MLYKVSSNGLKYLWFILSQDPFYKLFLPFLLPRLNTMPYMGPSPTRVPESL